LNRQDAKDARGEEEIWVKERLLRTKISLGVLGVLGG
jgi:hypothetical protein